MGFVVVNPRDCCPICGKPDWCCVSTDGKVANCMRVESGKMCKNGGWIHKLTDPVPVPKPRPKRTGPLPNFARLARKYRNNLPDLTGLSKELGVSCQSLHRLEVGFDGKNYSFPMKSTDGRIIGIRLRNSRGKFAVPGSKNGLFFPVGINLDSKEPLFICEGPTDVAAWMDLAFDVIGRFSCSGNVEDIKMLLSSRCYRPVVIMEDQDEGKLRPDGSIYYPGQEGAARLAKEVKPLCQSVKIAKPYKYKDCRQWLNNGATREKVLAIVDMTRFV